MQAQQIINLDFQLAVIMSKVQLVTQQVNVQCFSFPDHKWRKKGLKGVGNSVTVQIASGQVPLGLLFQDSSVVSLSFCSQPRPPSETSNVGPITSQFSKVWTLATVKVTQLAIRGNKKKVAEMRPQNISHVQQKRTT